MCGGRGGVFSQKKSGELFAIVKIVRKKIMKTIQGPRLFLHVKKMYFSQDL